MLSQHQDVIANHYSIIREGSGSVINISPFGFRMWMTNDNPADYGYADFSWVALSYPEPVGV
jgi:hypothetical protein